MNCQACVSCLGQGRISKPSRKKNKPTSVFCEVCSVCEGLGVVKGANLPLTPLSSSSPDWDVDVAIVGCGIGGAAAALALQQRGISVKVYEKDEVFAQRKQGYGLTMQQGAIALARLGIPVTGTSSLAHVSFLPDGTVIGCYGRELDERAETMNDESPSIQRSHKLRHNIQIPRQRLRAMLVHRLDPNVIEWNCKYERFEDDGNGVNLIFSNRNNVRAGVVVGADGIFSAVRCQKFPNPEYDLRYLGVIVILGIVDAKIESLYRRVTQTLDGETRIFTMPFTSSSDPPEELDVGRAAYFDQERFPPRTDVTMWQLSFPCTEEFALNLGKNGGGGGEALKREALRRCGKWHYPIPQLLEKTEPKDITGYPAYDCKVLTDFCSTAEGENSRTTVLGDAFHPMSPFKGQGANQALVDAMHLARHLSRVFGPSRTDENKTVSQILREYENETKVRAGEKVETSRKAAEYLHSKDALVVGNCVRSAASFERKEKMKTQMTDEIDEKRRENAKRLFEHIS